MNFSFEMRTRTITILIGVVLLIGAYIIYFIFFQKDRLEIIKLSEQESTQCLDENKKISYMTEDKEVILVDLTIFINDKLTGKELSSFKIDNVYRTVPRVELHKCGVYVIRFFNYNSQKTKQDIGFKAEIWKYQYNGEGYPFFLLSEKKESGLANGDYSYAFRIDPNEKYIVLEKGYLGENDYSLIIKDLKTEDDIFSLSMKEIVSQYPNIVGNFNMREWNKDGKYFWGDIFVGAYVNGFFRIDTLNWKTDVFEAPEGVGGGDALNIEKGLVTRHPGYVWTGLDILTEEIKKEWREQGKKSTLYLYNLFTKEQKLLEITDEPVWFFKPKWISDAELEYELPSGEKKIYKINE